MTGQVDGYYPSSTRCCDSGLLLLRIDIRSNKRSLFNNERPRDANLKQAQDCRMLKENLQ